VFNLRHKLCGHLFAGRYKALVVEGSGNGYLAAVCDYVGPRGTQTSTNLADWSPDIHQAHPRFAPIFPFAKCLRSDDQIATSVCPDEFRSAWLAYIQAWERYASPSAIERRQRQILASPTSRSMGGNVEGHGGLGVGGGISAHYDTTHENNAKLVEFLDREDTAQALRALESVALQFKVDALKYE
jgi:hypothetical protein